MSQIIERLQAHLEKNNFVFHSTIENYWNWVNNLIEKNNISPKLLSKLAKIQDAQVDNPTQKNKQKFVEFVAEYELFCRTAFSMQADAVLHSGACIAPILQPDCKYLDIGCSNGYLTSFYAEIEPKSEFWGFDVVKKLTWRASLKFSAIQNLHFTNSLDNSEDAQFHAVIDTQCLSHIGDQSTRKDLINRLHVLCKSDAKILSVAALPSVDDAEDFINTLHLGGFELLEIKPLYFEQFGTPSAFTNCIFQKTSKKPTKVDREFLDNLWKDIVANLR